MKKILVVFGWLIGVHLGLAVTTSTLIYLKQPQRKGYHQVVLDPNRTVAAIASPPEKSSVLGISSELTADDARPILIQEFLKTHQSPLVPYEYWGKFLTALADKYQLDYRLLPSIAMQESNLCKKIPQDTFNCLGLGIHSRGTWGFPSFEANFEKAAEILCKNYANQGLITPDQIQDKYTPGSNGSWEFAVNHFMDQLETADFN